MVNSLTIWHMVNNFTLHIIISCYFKRQLELDSDSDESFYTVIEAFTHI